MKKLWKMFCQVNVKFLFRTITINYLKHYR